MSFMKKILNNRHPYMFIAPSLILLTLFSIIPITIAFFISFTNLDLKGLVDFSSVSFIGLENYKALLTDDRFIKAILNTVFYVLIGVPLVVLLSLSIALLLNYGTSKLFTFLDRCIICHQLLI